MKLSHSHKIKLEKHYGVILVRLENRSGIMIGVYVKGTRENLEKISELKNADLEDLKKLGEIIATFEGNDPPEDIENHIKSLLL